MKRLLTSSGALLAIGSAGASALNFYSFVLFPSWFGTEKLGFFVRDNYLGGIYLAALGSSVAPLTIFFLHAGGVFALRRYAVLCLSGVVITLLVGWQLMNGPLSAACVAGALFMQIAGFLLTNLIQSHRIVAASSLQLVQPVSFAALISLAALTGASEIAWAYCYLASATAGVLAFVTTTDWPALRHALKQPAKPVSWAQLASRMLLCVSFSLFFQIELLLCGQLTTIDLGRYNVLQKLYSSITISLFGSIGILLLARHSRDPEGSYPVGRYALGVAATSALAVVMVAELLNFKGANILSPPAVAMGAVVSFLFTLSSFTSLLTQAHHPNQALLALLSAMGLYLLAFALWTPKSPVMMTTFASGFFGAHLLIAWKLEKARSASMSR